MGLNASGEVAYGIPIVSHDDYDGEPTPLWDEDNEDWSEKIYEAQCLDLVTFGHYECYDSAQALLTLKNAPTFHAYDYEPVPLDLTLIDENQLEKAVVEARDKFGLDFTQAKWYLVASYG